jgi:hypothetical protein
MLCSLEEVNSVLVSAVDSGAGVVGDRGGGTCCTQKLVVQHSRRRTLFKQLVLKDLQQAEPRLPRTTQLLAGTAVKLTAQL